MITELTSDKLGWSKGLAAIIISLCFICFLVYNLVKPIGRFHELNKIIFWILIAGLLSVERLAQLRDIFVFCCYTGLSYADVQKLKRSEIGKGVDGEK